MKKKKLNVVQFEVCLPQSEIYTNYLKSVIFKNNTIIGTFDRACRTRVERRYGKNVGIFTGRERVKNYLLEAYTILNI